MSLEDIKSSTQNFSVDNTIGRGGSRNVYKGVASHANGHTITAAKRLDRRLFGHKETGFFRELDIPLKYKHENVIGFCDDEIEKIILHDFASRGRLDGYLSDPSLTWVMRLKICIDIASGLNFLHATDVNQEVVIHRDIKSSNILIFDDWKAKITGFGLSFEQVDPQSFVTFARIAYQCLHHKRERRPKAGEVVIQLKRALEFNEDHELWESKLPRDYK
ncbi:kinase-like domain, phloem protein 2-like protein [Tanacetum coccineum]|uniref:Kinase-like domain, phloem protein 2-like protein n=1 Tax=Tanacetum coccineum TaxID=301880 RepID=A0ABQ4ZBD3_9ASTR